jgi:Calx-beta domain
MPVSLTIAEGASAAVIAPSAIQNGVRCYIDFEQVSGTAIKGTDFLEYATGPVFSGLSDAAGIAVTLQDTIVEGPETFTVKIKLTPGAVTEAWNTFYNCTIGNDTMTVTITDDDAAQEAFTITAPAPVTEGDSGTVPMVFTLSSPNPTPVACDLVVTATNGFSPVGQIWPANWVPANPALTGLLYQIITIPAGSKTATFTVNVIGDTAVEADGSVQATVTYALLGPSLHSCEVVTPGVPPVATAKILDDDAAPVFSLVTPAPVTEGNSGTTPLTVTITGTAAPKAPCGVKVYGWNPGSTAFWVFDWSMNGSFIPGDYYKYLVLDSASSSFTFDIIGDTVVEADETFHIYMDPSLVTTASGIVPACEVDTASTFLGAGVIGTINNDDTNAQVSISQPAPIKEGNSGTTPLTFKISTPVAPTADCTVLVSANNQTALWTIDWDVAGQFLYYKTVTIPAGSTSVDFVIDVTGDTVIEGDETFLVSMVGNGVKPCTVDVSKNTATGTILNDDGPILFSLAGPPSVVEGNAGVTPATYTVSAPNPVPADCQVLVSVTNRTALWTIDWNLKGELLYYKTITIPAGQMSADITVDVIGDTIREIDENYNVAIVGGLPNPCLIDATKSTVDSKIIDDETGPLPAGTTFSIDDVSVIEGDAGTKNMTFTVTLSAPAVGNEAVLVSTANLTATAGADYTAIAVPVVFAAGQTTKTVTVPIIGEILVEADETFNVVLSSPVNAAIAKGTGVGTIKDDDLRFVSISDLGIIEGNSGVRALMLIVSLDKPAHGGESVAVNTVSGTATAGTDFVPLSTTVTFAAGETSKTITVNVIGDTTVEPGETFTAVLSAPVNVSIVKGTGIGTIVDDDRVGPTTTQPGGPTTTKPGPTTTKPSPTTTKPGPTTTKPGPTTTKPSPTTTKPSPTTTKPGPTTTKPSPTTTKPGPTTTKPGPTTTKPSPTTTKPSPTTTKPSPTTTYHHATTTTKPSPTTTKPSPTTTYHHSTTTYHHATTTAYQHSTTTKPSPPTTPPMPVVRKVRINDVAIKENDYVSQTLTFTVSLDGPAVGNETVLVFTNDGTASAGIDYAGKSQTVVFLPGETTKTFSVTIFKERDWLGQPESDLRFYARMSSAVNVMIADGEGVAMITEK